MNSIIVPVDFSQQSEIALKTAASLAKGKGSKLYVLHMLEIAQSIMPTDGGVTGPMVLFLKAAERRFEAFLNKPYLEGVEVVPIIKHYKVFSEVNEVAKQHNIDLIVMGSHGTDGLEEFFVGSNTERVVRHSEVPVLVIKKECDLSQMKNFVFASDFKDDGVKGAQMAEKMAKQLNVDLKMVYVNTPVDAFLSDKDANERFKLFMDAAGLKQEVDTYNDYQIESGVLNYADEQNADIIGIATHGRKGLAHFFRGSLGEDIANHSKIPVMTFKI